jgi:hypothetical protein
MRAPSSPANFTGANHGGGIGGGQIINAGRAIEGMSEEAFVSTYGKSHWGLLFKWFSGAEGRTNHQTTMGNLKHTRVTTPQRETKWDPTKEANLGDIIRGHWYHRRRMAAQLVLVAGLVTGVHASTLDNGLPLVGESGGSSSTGGNLALDQELGGSTSPTVVLEGETPAAPSTTAPAETTTTAAAAATPEGTVIPYLNGFNVICAGETDVEVVAGDGRGQTFGKANPQLEFDSEPQWQWVAANQGVIYPEGYVDDPGASVTVLNNCLATPAE